MKRRRCACCGDPSELKWCESCTEVIAECKLGSMSFQDIGPSLKTKVKDFMKAKWWYVRLRYWAFKSRTSLKAYDHLLNRDAISISFLMASLSLSPSQAREVLYYWRKHHR